jgi:hypothetical protein
MTFRNHLRLIGACTEARSWAGNKTAKEAWDTCERADWLLWWTARDGASRQDIVKVSCKIARSVVKLAKTPLALEAIKAAEKWVKSPTTENQAAAREAARQAWRAADAADAAYAAAAAAAAADADADAVADVDAAAAAYAVAAYAAAADADVDAAAARQKQQAKNLLIVRRYLSQPWTETE